jgi:anhydro-N-acetylmuramic acid kinase
MSGTSLDGLDIACCVFERKNGWKCTVRFAQTRKYDRKWKQKLGNAFNQNGTALDKLDMEFGNFIGTEVRKFIKKHRVAPDLIASHGHTIFHQPHKKYTLQIGNGQAIANAVKLPVTFNFRIGDVLLGGQGAPLVPMADKTLFTKFEFCLNLGGIANISFDKGRKRIAYDICPVNIVMNELAQLLGREFDRDGKIGRSGRVDPVLLKEMNALAYYKTKAPKSIGREWVEDEFIPLVKRSQLPVKDKLRTVVEHIGMQIGSVVNDQEKRSAKMLVTGGGAYNKFLISRIRFYSKCKVVLPDDKTIQFKEAMAFALLGMLKMRGEINILKSVTGASRDSSGGEICYPA